MIVALLPVKALCRAKQRLSGILTPDQRSHLAFAMYETVLETLCKVRAISRIAVVTSDEQVRRHARSMGVELFEETVQHSHCESVDTACLRAMETGASTVAVFPIDIPLATAAEIEALVARPGRGVTLVPSADGTGTNALVRTPPDAIPSCFGPGSFIKHSAQAHSRNVPLTVARPPGVLLDIDTPEDISLLLKTAPDSPIAAYLRAQCKYV